MGCILCIVACIAADALFSCFSTFHFVFLLLFRCIDNFAVFLVTSLIWQVCKFLADVRSDSQQDICDTVTATFISQFFLNKLRITLNLISRIQFA